jgi:DNA polymerase-3 subunit beta
MRFSVLGENIKKSLGIVNRAVSTRSSLPVLGNVLLATDEGRIKLQATDLSIGITTWCGAKVEAEGAVTLPAKMLSDIIGALPNDVINFDLNTAKQIMSYSCAGFKGTIAGLSADEFPIIPRVSLARLSSCPPMC